MLGTVMKVIVATVISAIVFLGLYQRLGYERTELLAFSLLIGISIATLKPHKKKKKKS